MISDVIIVCTGTSAGVWFNDADEPSRERQFSNPDMTGDEDARDRAPEQADTSTSSATSGADKRLFLSVARI